MFNVTKMASRENEILELFFNSPKHWHFEEMLREVRIGRPQLARWLKAFEKEGIIKRVKQRGKMPYYVQDFHSPRFDIRKKIYAKQKLASSGLLEHLASLEKAKVIILFGSFSRSDWHRDSDIDIFIYGSDDDFKQGKYELKLHRDIEVHAAKDRKDLKRIDKMLPYIVSGDYIKGSIQDLGVEVYAKA